jgi:hypothetical protein
MIVWIGHTYMDLWSNIWAPSVWTLLGLGLHNHLVTRLHKRHHAEVVRLLGGKDEAAKEVGL